MDTLACIKRVPDTGAKITLTADQQDIDTSHLGFTMSPHEECAIEEAIQLAETHDGSATVLSLGPDEACEQLRTGLAMTADEALLLETDDETEWGPRATASSIADAIRERSPDDGLAFDVLLFGNESADNANHQVGIRVADALDVPFVAGLKGLDVEDGTAIAEREIAGGHEVYEVDLPAAFSVKEGINTPRYASMRSKMQARKQEIPRHAPSRPELHGAFEKIRLESQATDESEAELLGEGPEAVPAIVDVLRDDVEVLSR